MEAGARIESYKDLRVWKRGMSLATAVYELTAGFPKREEIGLASQMRRASVSIPSNIAEGYGRQSTGDYKRFLSVARGSLYELETQLLLCQQLGLLDSSNANGILASTAELSKMLSSLIAKVR
jgi:four helix bundle protein